jgi:uncharacterized protein
MAAARPWFELAALFVVAPLLFAVAVQRTGYRGAMFPVLWVLAAICLGVLIADPSFDRSVLFRLPLGHPYAVRAAVRFLVLASALAIVVRRFAPQAFFQWPRRNPRLFVLFIFGYPLLSALPQGIIWRVLFLHRYGPLFDSKATAVLASAVVFALAHATFRNVVAIVLTAIGGALFAWTYLETGSMWLATIEHGAYGVAAFAFGLGEFLYLGTRRHAQAVVRAPRP